MNNKNEDFHILIVDDNKELRAIIQEYLACNGDAVEVACDGKDALRKYAEHPYDLIITDLNMPELSGIEMIKRISSQNDITEFIIVTGYASLDTAVEAVKVGAFDYIVKPFRMEELQVVVKNVKDKILLRKTNRALFEKLNSLYEEIERYKQSNVPGEKEAEVSEPGDDTERIVNEIENLGKLIKGRLMIE